MASAVLVGGVWLAPNSSAAEPGDCSVVAPAQTSCAFTSDDGAGGYIATVGFTLTSTDGAAAGVGHYDPDPAGHANPNITIPLALTAGATYTVIPDGPGLVGAGG